MANEPMKLGEQIQVEVTRAKPVDEHADMKPGEIKEVPVETKLRHTIAAWVLLLGLFGSLIYGGYVFVVPSTDPAPAVHDDQVGLTDRIEKTVHRKAPAIGGVLYFDIIRAATPDSLLKPLNSMFEPFRKLAEPTHFGPIHNTVATVGKTAMRDCLGGTGTPTCTTVQAFKYHGLGTSSTAPAAGDTGCTTELTTQYNPDNTRATGSQTNNGSTVYRTVGTNTVDASATVAEFCLMSAASSGTLWGHVLTGTVSLSSGDSLQTTYDLTIN